MGSVRLVDPSGGPERAVADGALWYGGLSWSPDGASLAFSRSDGDGGANIVTLDVDGIDERQVTDLRGWATEPSWSPDGQLIAFSHYDQRGTERDHNGTRYASVVGALSGTPLEHAAVCRPIGRTSGTTAGFPLPDWAPSARGTVRVAVLFMDFPDAQATHTTEEEAARGLDWAEEYLERSSYRKLDVEFVPHHEWLRADEEWADYLADTPSGKKLARGTGEHAVALADADFDFSSINAVMTVFPSTHFDASGNAGGTVSADGVTVPHSRINVDPRDEPAQLLSDVGDWHFWGSTAAHELVHNLGLLDLYPFSASAHQRPEPPDGHGWVLTEWGLMGLRAYYLAKDIDHQTYVPVEMLAWHRWQLGWLNERQVHCVTDETAAVTLAPVARTGGAVAMAAVPINRYEVIVIESRRDIGYDRYDGGGHGWRAYYPNLAEEGVLVYTVDTLVDSGDLPVLIAGDNGNGQVESFPVLQPGESVTIAGYTITVTADSGDTHTVHITRNA